MLAQPVFATTVQQTAQGSLGSVTEESQILPIPGEKREIYSEKQWLLLPE